MKFINPEDLYDPRPNGYSHVVVADAPARIIYIAGQGGENAHGELSEEFGEQVEQALHNLRAALAAASAAHTDVAKVTALIVDHSEARLAIFSKALRAMWSEHPAPACTLIPVPRLALDGMLFEIDATVVQQEIY
ncbi:MULTISPECIES: RidA family protein [unclassified Duganella]|jgi:enamine deaminase RidA (YjgF/YER057c/UK114 family)|uniref:RidA family protein n=1 Tax=unclassified Duganella TaxID=2636909 RepID=UPI000891D03A|nr:MULTISPECIES: Rid family hydrolase [unclassified Duganella]SDG94528.1 Enamine deaminase RidA, house cleaning of reactive enamine intermediates, YjgF/YER057c/UK114 family [Duganella sp. OV458]SDJ47857.1 Enamine deaminase RidA, house cleaning of reactive enamine intermediates, YjgF/YER057c/UK114 family [Duganella sp. OV510]